MSDVRDKINAILKEAEAKIAEAEKLADESGEMFHWDGPAYGMGGYYTPETEFESSDGESWSSSDVGWAASSQSC